MRRVGRGGGVGAGRGRALGDAREARHAAGGARRPRAAGHGLPGTRATRGEPARSVYTTHYPVPPLRYSRNYSGARM